MDDFGFELFMLFMDALLNDKMDEERIKRETTREVTTDRRFLRTTTLTKIQEGEFVEIEDTETKAIAIRKEE